MLPGLFLNVCDSTKMCELIIKHITLLCWINIDFIHQLVTFFTLHATCSFRNAEKAKTLDKVNSATGGKFNNGTTVCEN